MKSRHTLMLFIAAALLTAVGCKKSGDAIKIDGSSTVYPITEAVAEEFQADNKARVTIGVSGTGGGFKKFCRKETVLTGASRPIQPVEIEACEESGVEYIELPIAYDGITVVINPENDWAREMTVADLKKIWQPAAQGKIKRWNQVREDWPDEPLNLYGAGIDSGTYDYFTLAVVGTEHASRGDFTSSEDDNVIVNGVSGDKNGLGFFGFAYFDENRDLLDAVAIKPTAEAPAVEPSLETIKDGSYTPLFRPLFLYVQKQALDEDEMLQKLVEFYLTEASALIEEVGYVALPERGYKLALERANDRVTGSVFEEGGSTVGVSVEQLLSDGSEPEVPADEAEQAAAAEAEALAGDDGDDTDDEAERAAAEKEEAEAAAKEAAIVGDGDDSGAAEAAGQDSEASEDTPE
jgi:phosphate transport system substrate-binding protein